MSTFEQRMGDATTPESAALIEGITATMQGIGGAMKEMTGMNHAQNVEAGVQAGFGLGM